MTRGAYRVVGRVQGVGFRHFAARSARALGLAGGVRNEADGSVVAVAEGSDEALREFRRALERGPGASRVERVEEIEGPFDDEDYDAAF